MQNRCPLMGSHKNIRNKWGKSLSVICICFALYGCATTTTSEPAPAPRPSDPVAVIEMNPIITPVPTPIPTPTPEPLPFSIIWLPDTQLLCYGYPEALEAMGGWIAENAETENIRYVVHTGDITDNGFKEWQWKNFDLCYGQFQDSIPYFPVAGNHDLGVKLGDYTAYLDRPFLDAFPPENQFEGGKALYAELQVSGLQLLLVGACWGAELEAMDWMKNSLPHMMIMTVLFYCFTGIFGRTDGTCPLARKYTSSSCCLTRMYGWC